MEINLPPALLTQLVDSSQDGIVIAEKEGRDHILIYVNKGFEKMTGYKAEEVLYQDCRFLQGAYRDQLSIRRIREALQANRSCCEIVQNYKKDGSLFWNQLSITPYYAREENLLYYIGVQKDVTEEMVLRNQLQLQNA